MAELWMTEPVLREMQAHAEASRTFGVEAVGALLGQDGMVVGTSRLTNASSEPEMYYEVTPRELAALYATVEVGPLSVLGFYHSHPRTDADPSAADVTQAQPGFIYVIIGWPGDGSEAEVCGWKLNNDPACLRDYEEVKIVRG